MLIESHRSGGHVAQICTPPATEWAGIPSPAAIFSSFTIRRHRTVTEALCPFACGCGSPCSRRRPAHQWHVCRTCFHIWMDVRTEPMTEDLCPFHLVPFRQFRGLSIDNQHHAEFYRCRASSLPRRLFFSDFRRPSSPPGSPKHYLFGEHVQAPLPRRHSFHDLRETILSYRDALTYVIVDEPVGRWTYSMFGTIVKGPG